MKRKNLTYAMLIASMFMLTACPSDDDEAEVDNPSVQSKASEKFVGFWTIDDVKTKTGQKHGKTINFILFDNGKIRTSTDSSRDRSWTYNEKTGVLSTSAQIDEANLQWEITLSGHQEWSGIALWSEDRTTHTARTGDYFDFIKMLLNGSTWENADGERITFEIPSYGGLNLTTNTGYICNIAAYLFAYSEYNDQLVFGDRNKRLDHQDTQNITYTICHPYSPKDTKIIVKTIFPEEIKSGEYVPVSN